MLMKSGSYSGSMVNYSSCCTLYHCVNDGTWKLIFGKGTKLSVQSSK